MATKAGTPLVFLAFVFFGILLVLQLFRKPTEHKEGFSMFLTGILTSLAGQGAFSGSSSNKKWTKKTGEKCKRSDECYNEKCRNKRCN